MQKVGPHPKPLLGIGTLSLLAFLRPRAASPSSEPSLMAGEELLLPTTTSSKGRGAEKEEEEEDQVVNPWEVSAKDGGRIDYDKLVDKFGCQRLDPALVRRVERLTNRPAHAFLRRGVFFAHRYNVDRSLFPLEDVEWGIVT